MTFDLKSLKSIYINIQFRPGILGIFLNPFYFARKGLYLHIRSLAKHITGKTLDVGCGNKPYEDLFHSTEYIGLEIDHGATSHSKKADVLYKGNRFPFDDAAFDSVVLNQVLEHVFEPENFLKEIHRVLKPSGLLLLTVPFVWDEHEQPFDFSRYSSFGLIHLLQKSGFEVLEHKKSVNDIRIIFQLLNVYLYKMIKTRNKYIPLILAPIFSAPVNIIGEIMGWIFPRNNDFFLDNVVLARKPADALQK